MGNEAINSQLPHHHNAVALDEEKDPTVFQPPKYLDDRDPSSHSSQTEFERDRMIQGSEKFNRLGWKRLTIVLIVEAIALGSLSLPAAFATLGMVAGVICSVVIGLIATYASFIVGAVKIKYPQVENYGDIGRLLLGEAGFWIITAVFVLSLLLGVGSHCLTGIIALVRITESDICTVIFGLVSAIILLLAAIPPTFAELAVLGYIDFASIVIAIGITIIATGVQRAQNPGGLASSTWSAWPKEDADFPKVMVAINNIVFAYSFAPTLPTFMTEMHTPKDYVKSVYLIGFIEIILYTLIGSLVYCFVGQEVQSPALLSAGPLVSRIAFGVALPVIFISGSINTSVIARYLHGHVYRNSVVRYVNTKMGWITWIALVSVLTFLSWIVAEAIPVFSDMLSICAALFNSGLCFYVPSVMWLVLLKDGSLLSGENVRTAFYNGVVFLFGIGVLVCGMYANILNLVSEVK
ncbi:uncharacterized protein N7482_000252 [Penicillium canariense]|uniref:Amino acid transporter transmembrane domain-containing protein n=1 Tax=Penicillium canariense TaxID=189055 RepID=A0A9W9IBH9_9EURO|nr:uncharacterized protein N7482_000252 [Penicillium canariense]KAJ5174375.1 hypothetical protein N7482_000252 [Penicillium canariense]